MNVFRYSPAAVLEVIFWCVHGDGWMTAMKHKKVPVAIDNMLADIFFCVAYFWAT